MVQEDSENTQVLISEVTSMCGSLFQQGDVKTLGAIWGICKNKDILDALFTQEQKSVEELCEKLFLCLSRCGSHTNKQLAVAAVKDAGFFFKTGPGMGDVKKDFNTEVTRLI
eukprot:767698-Hanusia_phi.AAC.4